MEDTNLANAMSDDIAIVSAARTPIGENMLIFYIRTKSDQMKSRLPEGKI